MKKFTKIFVIIGLCLMVIGGIVAGISYAIGIPFDRGQIEYRTEISGVNSERTENTVDGQGKIEISVSVFTNDVYVYPSGDDQIHIYYYDDLYKSYQMTESEEGDTHYISFSRAEYADDLPEEINLFGENSGDVTIEVPANPNLNLTISTASGEVKISDIQAGAVSVNGTSGNLTIGQSELSQFTLETISGEIYVLESQIEGLAQVGSSSGDVVLRNVKMTSEDGALNISTISGEVRLQDSEIPGEFRCDTSSGDVHVEENNLGGDIDISTISGEIEMDLKDPVQQKEPEIDTISGEVKIDSFRFGTKEFKLSTTSGDISVERED